MKPSMYYVRCLITAVLALLAACSGNHSMADANASPAPRRTSVDYVLSPGQSVAIAPSVTLKLDHVNDSRCKTGAVCVWAGYLSYSFTLSSPQGNSAFVLSDTMPNGSKSAVQQKLRFTLLSTEPDTPPTAKQPAPPYRVTLQVAIT